MRLILVAALLLGGGISHAQDPIFTQFFAVPLQLNPAFSGSSYAPRFGLAYRHQWPAFAHAYRTYAAFYEQRIDRWNSGIGFYIENDNAGDGIYRKTNAVFNYAYQINFTSRLALKLGIDAGLRQIGLDWDRLTFPDQLDPIKGSIFASNEIQPDVVTTNRLDIGSGLLFGSDQFWIGASMKHLNSPNETLLLVNENLSKGLPIRYTFHGGMEITVKKGNKRQPGAFMSPNFLFTMQGPYKQLNVGSYFGLGSFFAGGWFRHAFGNSDAAILMAGFRQGVFKIGVSYDATVSGLASQTAGTYEMSIGFALDKSPKAKKKQKNLGLNDCMRMFQ